MSTILGANQSGDELILVGKVEVGTAIFIDGVAAISAQSQHPADIPVGLMVTSVVHCGADVYAVGICPAIIGGGPCRNVSMLPAHGAMVRTDPGDWKPAKFFLPESV